MASSNKTPNLELPQWELNDKPEMSDFNDAFNKVEDFKDEFDSHKAENVSQGQIPHIGLGGSYSHSLDTGVVTNPEQKQVNASLTSQATGSRSQVNACATGIANGDKSQVNACTACETNGEWSQINASTYSEIGTHHHCVILASGRVKPTFNYQTIGGYSASGEASSANIKWLLAGHNGNIQHAGTISSGHNFTDFAELLPNLTGEKQGYGLLQTIDGHGVRPAQEGERVIGVTSATAGIILGNTPFSWQGRWLKDEWGAYIYETIIDEETGEEMQVPRENPDWNPEEEQVSRMDRPDEWTVVGLMGQVYVRLREDVEVMDYVKAWQNGVGQTSEKSTNIQVMKITQEYDEGKGYKIGFCLLK